MMIKVAAAVLSILSFGGATAFAASPFTFSTQLTVATVIQQQKLSSSTMTAPASGTVGTLSTTCSTQSACGSPTYAFQTTSTGSCSAAQIAKNSDFLLSGTGNNTLTINPSGPDVSGGGLPVGSYPVGIATTVAGANQTPLCFPQSITVNPAGVTPLISINGSTTGTTVASGATVTVAVSGGPGNTSDFMALCNTNTSCGAGGVVDYSDYASLNCSKSGTPSGTTSGTCSLTAPTTVGNYYADFLTSNTHVIAFAPFTVSAGTNPSITGVKFNSTGNAAITKTQGFSGTIDSLVTTCSATCPGTASYAVGTGTGCTTAQTADNSSFVTSGSNLNTAAALGAARDYLVGVVDTMSGVTNSASCWPLTVHSVAATGPSITVNGQPSGATVTAGASITVAASGGPVAGQTTTSSMDICAAGTPSSSICSPYQALYLNCTTTAPASVINSASCSMTAPSSAGNYQVFWSPTSGNYTPAATASFIVQSGTVVANYYVDPNGSDINPGTQALPWQTVGKAASATQNAGTAITIAFNSGTYPLSGPIGLNGDMHGSVWTAAAGARPVFSGGVTITGWTLHDAGNNIWQAAVPAGLDFREFYVNGHAAMRARGLYATYTFTSTGFTDPTGGVQGLSDLPDVEIENINGWQYGACQVQSVSGAAITMNPTCWTQYTNIMSYGNSPGKAILNWAENAYELLTASGAGSFYLKKSTNTVYYIPKSGENMSTAVGTAPRLAQFYSGQLSNMTFSNLTFAYSSWLAPNTQGYFAVQAGLGCWGPSGPCSVPPEAFELANGSSGNVFQNNLFMGLSGTYAIHVATGSSNNNNKFIANQFYENAGGAILVGAYAATTTPPSGTLIQYNDIVAAPYQSGYYDAPGLSLNETVNSTVTQNHIANWFWATAQIRNAQSQNTSKNVFTYNRADNNCIHLYDCAGIYSTDYDTGTPDSTSPKFTVSNNYFSHITGSANTACMYGDGGTWLALYQNNVCDNPATYFTWFNGSGDVVGVNSGSNTVTNNYGNTLAQGSYLEGPGDNISNNIQFTSGSPPSAAQAIIAAAGIPSSVIPGPGGPPPAGPAITVNGKSSGTSVAAGAAITVAVSNGPVSGQTTTSTMGICNAGTPPSPGTCFGGVYLNCSNTTPPTGVLSSASCSMTAPSAGNYQAWWSPTSGNYTPAATATFTVTSSTGSACTATGSAAQADLATAGFTTCVIGNDFTAAIPNTVGTGLPNNWLNCVIGDTTPAVWYAGFENYITSANQGPCVSGSGANSSNSNVYQATDPVYGNLALVLHQPGSQCTNPASAAAEIVGGGCSTSFGSIPEGTQDTGSFTPGAWSPTNKGVFPSSYVEITMRADNPGNVNPIALWSAPMPAEQVRVNGSSIAGCCWWGYEIDQMVLNSSGQWSTDTMQWVNFTAGQNKDSSASCGSTCLQDYVTEAAASLDSAYHTWGVLSTTDGAGNFSACAYYDGVKQSCHPAAFLDANDAQERRAVWWWANTLTAGVTSNAYVKSVNILSCGAWQTTMCDGTRVSSLNAAPPGNPTGLHPHLVPQ